MKEYKHEHAEMILYIPSDFEKLGGICPLRIGRNIAKPNYFVGPRIMEHYSLHFVLNGSVSFSDGKEVFKLSKGDVFCLYPRKKYSYWVTDFCSDSPLSMFWFAFYGNQAGSLLERTDLSVQKPFLQNKVTAELSALLNQLLETMRNHKNDEDLKLQAMIYHLFGGLTQLGDRSPTKSAGLGWLQKSVQYIDTHFMEGITVSDVVQVAGVHRSHLYSEFINVMGISPRQYLIELRMKRASEMLRINSFSITEISLSTGYLNVYSFSRAFYNYYGMSPSNYRKKMV